MPFDYPDHPHVRKHGPTGYESYKSFKEWLRDEFAFLCAYCLERERWYPSGQDAFAVDHIHPKAIPEYRCRECDYENLLYACNRCNCAKGQELVLDPCSEAFALHLVIDDDGCVRGTTSDGRELVDILGLDRSGHTSVREKYLRIVRLFQRYPSDPEVRELYLEEFGFPDELPDLEKLRPPGNERPEGIAISFHRRRQTGELPSTY